MGANNLKTRTPVTTVSGVAVYSDGLATPRVHKGYLGEKLREFRWIIGER
jgi:hypothetical protein